MNINLLISTGLLNKLIAIVIQIIRLLAETDYFPINKLKTINYEEKKRRKLTVRIL